MIAHPNARWFVCMLRCPIPGCILYVDWVHLGSFPYQEKMLADQLAESFNRSVAKYKNLDKIFMARLADSIEEAQAGRFLD